MTSSTIVSLAILKANWDLQKRDYLENFVPIVAECIRLSRNDVISLPDLQASLGTRFGLRLPQNSIRSILRRVRKRGYIQRQHRVYVRNLERLDQLNFHIVQQEVMRRQETLVEQLIAFYSTRFHTSWSPKEAENALLTYLEENQLLVLDAASYGTVIPTPEHPVKSAKYIVGSFIQYLQETSAASFDYLETIVIGNMLANAIFLTELGRAGRRFKRTDIYLDTAFLMSTLGYDGEARAAPCIELLELLYTTGANLGCFKHTVDEIRGILDTCAYLVGFGRTRDAYGSSIEHFLCQGYTASDIELLSVTLERDLGSLRIRVMDKPPYIHKYVIDEQALSDTLNEKIGYRNPKALARDVDSVSAIMRLRKGQEFYKIEECRALFVTTNLDLVRISRDFFYGDHLYSGVVSPCTTDYTLTNLLWLKSPLKAPGLPRKRIIADCYAATQPDERLWRRYLEEINKLEQGRIITTDDYYLLRYKLEAKSALMELTLGEDEAFTQGTVPEILKIVQSNIQADLKAKLAEETSRRSAVEESVAQGQVMERKRVAHIKARAKRYASVVAKGLEYVVLIFAFVGTLATFPWEIPAFGAAPMKYMISLILVATFISSIINQVYGTPLKVYMRKLEVALEKRIFKTFLEMIEIS